MSGMTGRNVRDIFDRTISKIRKGMYEVLKRRQAEDDGSLTLKHKAFLNSVDIEKEKQS